MAVYTDVSLGDLARWLAGRHPALGEVTAFTPIAQGIENTNYFVDTARGRYVLTLLERTAPEAIDFPITLMKHLATHGIRCPEPQAASDGSLWAPLNGKPATLATRLPGRQLEQPDPAACAAIGRLLARMHLAAADYPFPVPPNPRGLAWWPAAVADVVSSLAPDTRHMLVDELAVQQTFAASAVARSLPRSAVHADLFLDNALFDEAGEPGVIDFYFACEESWGFDLAVTVNDWCLARGAGPDMVAASVAESAPIDPSRIAPFDPARVTSLLDGYQSVRPLQVAEIAAFPTLLRAGALRFWLSRLHDLVKPRNASLLSAKDPKPFENLLQAHRDNPAIRNHLSTLAAPAA